MNDFISWFTNIASQLGNWGYVVMALICFLEALPIIGFFIPMVIAVLLAGFLVSIKVFNFSAILIICALAAVLGDFVAFSFGRHFSKSFKKEHKILKEEYLTKASAFMHQRGVLSVFWGRFIGPIRPMICFVAGTTKLSWNKFIYPAVFSSFLFVSLYLGIGYVAGSAWQTATNWSSRLALVIGSLVVIILALIWLGEFIFRRGKQLNAMFINLLRLAHSSLQEKSFWKSFNKKYPRFSLFFIKRTDPNNFFGLALSVLIILEVIFIFIVFYLSRIFLSANNLFTGFDLRVHNFITLFSESHLATGFFLITTLGSAVVVTTICLLTIIWFFLEKRWSYIIGLLISVLGGAATSSLLKYLVARQRPIPTFYFENSFAWPSGHATIAVTLFLFLIYYAVRAYPRWSRDVGLVITTSLLVLLIGTSRLYLGVHYFSDILGGYLLGFFWFILAVIISRFLEKDDEPCRLKKSKQIGLIISFIILFLIIFSTQIFGSNALRSIRRYSTVNLTPLKSNNLSNLTFVSENLGGNNWQPMQIILNGPEVSIKQALQDDTWIQRTEPTIPGIIKRGLGMTFKQPFLTAPLKPRYWHNQTNNLTFTKLVKDKKKNITYILRLWLVVNNNDQVSYLGEMSVSQGFSLQFSQKEPIIKKAIAELVASLNNSKFLDKSKTMTVAAKLREDAKEVSNFIVYIFTFK